jgi:hypothetical protein
MSVVATGSKLVNSGWVGPEVRARATVGETISVSKERAVNAQMILVLLLFLSFSKKFIPLIIRLFKI